MQMTTTELVACPPVDIWHDKSFFSRWLCEAPCHRLAKLLMIKKKDNSNHSTVKCPARNAGENMPYEQRTGKDVLKMRA